MTDLIIAAVLGCGALRSQQTGVKLGAVMAAIPLGIAMVNLIEGAFFLSQPGVGWGRIAIETILGYLLVAPAWAFIFGRIRRPQIVKPVAARTDGTVWKFLVSDVVYLVLYYTAGMVIFRSSKIFMPRNISRQCEPSWSYNGWSAVRYSCSFVFR